MTRKAKVTIQDIARHAGVGVGTVSRVLNGHPSVSAETEATVRKTIEDLGYRPVTAAQTLRTQRSNTLGFITDVIATTPYAGQIIRGAQMTAWKYGKLLFLVNTESDPELERMAIDVMIDRQVDGLLYATMFHHSVTVPSSIFSLPTVLLDCYTEDSSLASVVPDEFTGGYQATKVLIDRGHRRISFLNDCMGFPPQRLRGQGYRCALTDHDIPVDETLIAEASSEPAGGYQGMKSLLQLKERPTAVFCFNDRMAMGAYEAIRQQGLRIPQDIAVVGFDNQELIAASLWPALTTMQLPHYEMGVWAVEHLLAETIGVGEPGGSAERSPPQMLLPCPLVMRDSV